jgi:hypothetical protein
MVSGGFLYTECLLPVLVGAVKKYVATGEALMEKEINNSVYHQNWWEN